MADNQSTKSLLGYIWTLTNDSLRILEAAPLNKEDFDIVSKSYLLFTRSFHDLVHSGDMTYMTEPEYFEFNKNRTVENPNIIKAIVQVASVFHDDAYAHVDGGLTSEISDKLKSYIEPVDESNKK